jgi:hypothetical protein
MRFMMIVVVLFAVVEAAVQAGPLRRSRQNRMVSAAPRQAPVLAQSESSVRRTEADAMAFERVDDALQEVNAERAKRGLRPFLPDPLLNQAARACAKIRATKLIESHLSNDFAYLPSGASATAAGCGALDPSWGWGTCCTYDSYTYAGAAWVRGSDGKRYMHLFVR